MRHASSKRIASGSRTLCDLIRIGSRPRAQPVATTSERSLATPRIMATGIGSAVELARERGSSRNMPSRTTTPQIGGPVLILRLDPPDLGA